MFVTVNGFGTHVTTPSEAIVDGRLVRPRGLSLERRSGGTESYQSKGSPKGQVFPTVLTVSVTTSLYHPGYSYKHSPAVLSLGEGVR
jgi:hypothetical protein